MAATPRNDWEAELIEADGPELRLRIEDVRRVGRQLFTPASYVEWCGHGQKVIPMPAPAGWCNLVPVVGEAS